MTIAVRPALVVGDCAVWAAAPATPSNRTATKARAGMNYKFW
jgi:hypothetical protein